MRHHLVLGSQALAAREPPGHRADFIERDVHRIDSRVRNVPVGHRELETGAHLLGRAAGRRESRPRGSGIVSIGLGNVENDTIHRPMNLVEERPVALAYDRKHLPKPARCLKRPLLNDESLE